MADVSAAAVSPPIQVRGSNVHGRGVFATRRIAKGERIIEYLGDRVSHDEADRRYESKEENDSHTFLFIVDSKTVIDAGIDGNDARFFNHSCNPNCESVVEKRRVYIEAIRAIEPGEEMTYDYQIYKEEGDPENIDEVFACRCGFANCRGTMLWPPEPKKPKKKPKKANKKEAAAGKSSAGRKSGGRSGRKSGKSAAGRSPARKSAKSDKAAKSTQSTKSSAKVAKKKKRRR